MKEIRRTISDVRTTIDRCEVCGEIPLTNNQILVRYCENDTSKHTYVFACPICKRITARPLSGESLDILVLNGCPMEMWKLPKEIFTRSFEGELTDDDAIDFHFLLQDDKLIESFFGGE